MDFHNPISKSKHLPVPEVRLLTETGTGLVHKTPGPNIMKQQHTLVGGADKLLISSSTNHLEKLIRTYFVERDSACDEQLV